MLRNRTHNSETAMKKEPKPENWLLQKLLQYLLSLNYVFNIPHGNFKLNYFQFNELL